MENITRQNVQGMINQLFSLPIKVDNKDNVGLIARLPPARSKTPREKPMPSNENRPMTRWEKYALRKGIRRNKKKRNLLAFDEESKTWKRRWGFRKANDPLNTAVYEHKENDG